MEILKENTAKVIATFALQARQQALEEAVEIVESCIKYESQFPIGKLIVDEINALKSK